MKSFRKIIISALCLLLATLTLILSSCAPKVSAAELSKDYQRKATDNVQLDKTFIDPATDFSMKLFTGAIKGKEGNQLISPASALICLAMLSNGASGKTAEQITAALGMDTDQLNRYLYTFAQLLSKDEKECKVKLADSVWIRNTPDMSVEPAFLQANADYYSAQVFSSDFDSSAVKDINNWVKNNTDGMIKEIIDNISPDTVMYLINTLLFDAKWQDKYENKDILDDKFTNYDGTETDVKMLTASHGGLIYNEDYVGFYKRYEGNFAFKAILPNEGTDIYEFAASLDGDDWREMTVISDFDDEGNYIGYSVNSQIPEFAFESQKMLLNDALADMGITDMFEPTADFSKMAKMNDGSKIYCSEFAQKTRIEVDRNGTKAAAVTWAGMKCGSTAPADKEVDVILDRPFVYAIVDTQTDLPLFIGIVSELN